jgi:hypothetical protein
MDHGNGTAGIADSLVHEEDVLANLEFNFKIRSKGLNGKFAKFSVQTLLI